MYTPRYLIWRFGIIVVFMTRRGGWEERLIFLCLLLRGKAVEEF
jgi:hypothetical protein